MIRKLVELDLDSLKRLQKLGDSLGNNIDPSFLLALQGASDNKDLASIEIDPRVVMQPEDSGQISPDVTQN